MFQGLEEYLDLGAGAVNARLDSEPGGEDQAKLSNASILHLAVGRRDKDIARTLIEHGADPNAGDCRAEFMGNSHEDITPLQLALLAEREISIDMLETLLEGGDGLEKTDSLGRTALMYAAYGGSKDAIEFLLERGADPDARITRANPLSTSLENSATPA